MSSQIPVAVLGAMLGNLGLPGEGVGYGYGCIHNFGFAGRRSPSEQFAHRRWRGRAANYRNQERIRRIN